MTIRPSNRVGYTLVELMVASTITLVVVAGAFASFIGIFRSWRGIELRMDADRAVNSAMSRLVYGAEGRRGLRAAGEGKMVNVQNNGGWTLTYWYGSSPALTNVFTYSTANSNLVFNPGNVVIAEGISLANVAVLPQSMNITLRVDRLRGSLRASRQLSTEVSFRN